VQHLVGSYLSYDLSAEITVYKWCEQVFAQDVGNLHKNQYTKTKEACGAVCGHNGMESDNPTKSMQSQHTYHIATLQKTTYPVPTTHPQTLL